MPIEPRRRHDIAVAVVAYDNANPQARLPRSAARVLAAMFPTDYVCQRSLDDIATMGGLNRKTLPGTLRRLVEAGILSRVHGSGSTPDTYQLQLPSVRR